MPATAPRRDKCMLVPCDDLAPARSTEVVAPLNANSELVESVDHDAVQGASDAQCAATSRPAAIKYSGGLEGSKLLEQAGGNEDKRAARQRAAAHVVHSVTSNWQIADDSLGRDDDVEQLAAQFGDDLEPRRGAVAGLGDEDSAAATSELGALNLELASHPERMRRDQ